MKRFSLLLIVLGCMLAANAVANDCGGALNCFRNHALPVLVHVNAKGEVTQVQPAIRLRTNVDRMLRKDLNRMITKPAMVQGHPVASQFVINLALEATVREDGKYDAHFAYVSAMPVPGGGWFWAHLNGHRLALVGNDTPTVSPHFYRGSEWNRVRSTTTRMQTSNPQPASMPGRMPTPSMGAPHSAQMHRHVPVSGR